MAASPPAALQTPSAVGNVDCRLHPLDLCQRVVAAARTVESLDGAHVVVIVGRGPVFHAEVHVCFSDRYVLVDVIGDDMNASVRSVPWDQAPCRSTPDPATT